MRGTSSVRWRTEKTRRLLCRTSPLTLVTGANQGIGLQIAKDLVPHGFTVLVGSRNLEGGEAAAQEVGPNARALLDCSTIHAPG
jgi:NAD(P)-dependent dehydrogenase (short-subunit alcohol dehydrogenase family)